MDEKKRRLREMYPEMYNNDNKSKKTNLDDNSYDNANKEEISKKNLNEEKIEKKSSSNDNIDEHIEGYDELVNSIDSKINLPSNLYQKQEKRIDKMKYILAGSVFLIVMYIIFLLMNYVIIPKMVHNRPMVKVPLVEKLNIEQAKERLLLLNLNYEVIGEQYNREYKAGEVINQDPNSGTNVKEQRPVYLIVSKGAEQVKVPNLIGLNYRKVKIKLMNVGLQIGRVDSVNSDKFQVNTILAQSPISGQKMQRDKGVNITISLGSEDMVIVPDVVGYSLTEIYQFLNEHNLVLGNVVYEVNELYDSNTIISQIPEAGSQIQKGSTINLTVAQ